MHVKRYWATKSGFRAIRQNETSTLWFNISKTEQFIRKIIISHRTVSSFQKYAHFIIRKICLFIKYPKLKCKISLHIMLKNPLHKRLNNEPHFFHASISYINREHECKKCGPLFKRLRYMSSKYIQYIHDVKKMGLYSNVWLDVLISKESNFFAHILIC